MVIVSFNCAVNYIARLRVQIQLETFFFHFFQTHLTYRFISLNPENRNLKIFMIAGIFGPYRDHDCRHIWSLSDTIAGILGPYRNQDCRHIWSPT